MGEIFTLLRLFCESNIAVLLFGLDEKGIFIFLLFEFYGEKLTLQFGFHGVKVRYNDVRTVSHIKKKRVTLLRQIKSAGRLFLQWLRVRRRGRKERQRDGNDSRERRRGAEESGYRRKRKEETAVRN